MSHANSTASASSNDRSTINDALKQYKKRTKIYLPSHDLVSALQQRSSTSDIPAFLRDQLVPAKINDERFSKFSKWLNPTINALSKFLSTINMVHPPSATEVFAGFGVLLSEIKETNEDQDDLIRTTFDRIESCFQPLIMIAPKVPETEEMMGKIDKILAAVLSILGIVTREMKPGQSENFLMTQVKKLKLPRKNDSREATLKRLEILTKELQDAAQIATAEPQKPLVGKKSEAVVAPSVSNKGSDNLLWDKIKVDIHSWLNPPDPSTNYNSARQVRHKGTAEWFLHGDTFEKWKFKGSLLWIRGMPGAGKSILSSAIIEQLQRDCKDGLNSVAYFSFDFRDNHKQSRLDMIPSLLIQLSAQSPRRCEILYKFFDSENDHGTQTPTGNDLKRCLEEMLTLPGEGYVYIIIDGIDECPNTPGVPSPREEVLDLLDELINLRFSTLWLCVTSRPELDIHTVLAPQAAFSISLNEEAGQKQDIVKYIEYIMNSDPSMRKWKDEVKGQVFKTLSERAGGMFRWTSYQLDTLKTAAPKDVLRILEELPKTLNETYERILKGISAVNEKHAVRILQCVTAAIRPLRVEELAVILSMDFDGKEAFPKFGTNLHWEDHERAVLTEYYGLVDVVSIDSDGSKSKVVQFSHQSVKDFLTSGHLASSSGQLASYHIARESAHTFLAKACVGDLLRPDGQIDKDPLAKYAAEFWVDHAQYWIEHGRVEDAPQILDGMKLLFDAKLPHFANWISLHDVDKSPGFSTTGPAPDRGNPLYYATLCNFYDLAKHLLDAHPKDINVRGGRYIWAIHAALYKEHVQIARLLITSPDADLNLRDDDDSTPLHVASESGYLKLVELLLDHNADVNATKSGHSPPLFAALKSGELEVIQLLLDRGAKVNVRDNKGSTPLHIASTNGLADIVQALLDRGAEVGSLDSNNSTPLHLASANGDLTVVNLLIDHKAEVAEVDARDNLDSTPLHLALINEKFNIVQVLVEKGANVNALSNRKLTPLHHAAVSGKLNAVKLLVNSGAFVDARDDEESTPTHLASEIGNLEVVRYLIDLRPSEVEAKDINGSSPLHRASKNGSVELVKLLIDKGADVNGRDKKNASPLHISSRRGPLETVELLLKHGADPNAQNDRGWSPLHIASQDGAVEVVKCLLERGANVNIVEGDRKTPLHVASHNKNSRIVRLLIDHGADPYARDNRNQLPYKITSDRSSTPNRSSNYAPAAPLSLPNMGSHSRA